MREAANKLYNNLSEQLNLYNYMCRMSIEKKEIIIKGSPDCLIELDRCIEAVACRILELEQDRQKILLGQVNSGAKLSEFINKLDKKTAPSFNKLRTDLINVMQEIQKINNLNIYLINSSIKWIEHSVRTITNHVLPESASYNAKGRNLNRSTYNYSMSGIVEKDA